MATPVNTRLPLVHALGLAALALTGIAPLTACDTTDMGLQPGATSVLEMFREPTPAEAAALAIDPYDPEKRYKGTLMLANKPFAGEAIYQRLFLDNIRDEDPGVRAASIRGLANHGSPEQAPAIIERLADADASVRKEAARGLQRIHNPAAIEPLLAMLDENKEADADVRAQAALALGQYPDPRVLQKLIETLDDPQLSVNHNTTVALRALTGQDLGPDRAAWVRWLEGNKRPFDAQMLFTYPGFSRSKYWIEYIPFVPPPPNEPPASPAGLSPAIP